MNKELMDLIKLQGDMRVALLKAGMNEEQSEKAAINMLNLVAISDCVNPEVKRAYQQFLTNELIL